MAARVKPLLATEVAQKSEALREEADAEFSRCWEEDEHLVKMNNLLGEALEGISDMPDVPEDEEQAEKNAIK